ncbi:hypothetical protein SODALDRAFT_360693 [Sodiomyces alkalinus F11]|uniref:Uncharacterized protein n=1 Tax=Sodiomyces alkalinus (strain CBS 110278 / VKM F-3762 / F11) TaxID=1314773 RepID=A0A3N2PV16_SODAK|nr:hypothetical protein SODALDRAFT_360693 [Sodiomyces alkalinus F11]ROT38330.1 hypothetical protein SODALDRAFT_360693 [Sodiomyces alkalinus F11]
MITRLICLVPSSSTRRAILTVALSREAAAPDHSRSNLANQEKTLVDALVILVQLLHILVPIATCQSSTTETEHWVDRHSCDSRASGIVDSEGVPLRTSASTVFKVNVKYGTAVLVGSEAIDRGYHTTFGESSLQGTRLNLLKFPLQIHDALAWEIADDGSRSMDKTIRGGCRFSVFLRCIREWTLMSVGSQDTGPKSRKGGVDVFDKSQDPVMPGALGPLLFPPTGYEIGRLAVLHWLAGHLPSWLCRELSTKWLNLGWGICRSVIFAVSSIQAMPDVSRVDLTGSINSAPAVYRECARSSDIAKPYSVPYVGRRLSCGRIDGLTGVTRDVIRHGYGDPIKSQSAATA